MRALVTGSLGFAGTHLCRHLRDAGDEVIGLDRTDGDLTEPGVADRLLSLHRPEVIYHLAGAADVAASWRDATGTWDANATATLRLLDAARAAGVRRVLVVSSADVYGRFDPAVLPLDERQPADPVSPYGASKLATEVVARQAWAGHGLETVIVRPFNHLGPGQRPAFVGPAIATAIAENEQTGAAEIPVGDLRAARDFTDVRDIARAYRLAMTGGAPGATYCACSGVATTIQELADRLVSMAAHPMRLVPDLDRYRAIDIPVLVGDAALLRSTTGWAPTISLDDTLADLLDDARQRVRARTMAPTTRSTP